MTDSATGVPPSRRLTLRAAELALLVHKGWLLPPPGFVAADEAETEAALRDAARDLADKGVVTARGDDPVDCEPVPAVAGNLAVLAEPQAVVHVEVAGSGGALRAVYGLAGPLGASLFALADGAAELSLFPAVALGRELVRAVPPAPDLRAREATEIAPALGEPPARPEPLAGQLPLAALTDRYGVGDPSGTAAATEALGLSRQQALLAAQVHATTVGTLRSVVTGRIRAGVVVGQVVWLATRDGWVGLQPETAGSGPPTVTLRPVERDELGMWLAPHLTSILEAAGEH